jgi:hypothetical protein
VITVDPSGAEVTPDPAAEPDEEPTAPGTPVAAEPSTANAEDEWEVPAKGKKSKKKKGDDSGTPNPEEDDGAGGAKKKKKKKGK